MSMNTVAATDVVQGRRRRRGVEGVRVTRFFGPFNLGPDQARERATAFEQLPKLRSTCSAYSIRPLPTNREHKNGGAAAAMMTIRSANAKIFASSSPTLSFEEWVSE